MTVAASGHVLIQGPSYPGLYTFPFRLGHVNNEVGLFTFPSDLPLGEIKTYIEQCDRGHPWKIPCERYMKSLAMESERGDSKIARGFSIVGLDTREGREDVFALQPKNTDGLLVYEYVDSVNPNTLDRSKCLFLGHRIVRGQY